MPDERGRPIRRPPPPRYASTKDLRSFAISSCQQFATSYEYIVGCLFQDSRRRFALDLLTGAIEPPDYDHYRNRCLTDRVSRDFKHLLVRLPHVQFCSAVLTCDVYDTPRDPLVETRITIRAVDGREWHGGIRQVGLRWPEDELVIPRYDRHLPAISRWYRPSLRPLRGGD